MYNGVGLPTPRGSGTSGHVQRNCALLYKREKVKHAEESKPDPINRQPNKDILEHTRKREIEVKCLELSDALEEQGYSEDEIDAKVQAYRKLLQENYAKLQNEHQHTDEYGRPIVRDSHQSAEAQLERNAKLRDAFGLSENNESENSSKQHVIEKTKRKT